MRRQISVLMILVVGMIPLCANPQGGQVTAGSASIAGQGSPSVSVNQGSNTAIINWQSFSIASGESTKFIQPSSTSATLNRVLGGQTSIIDGTLSANGRIFLLNGNGIVVGPNGVITAAAFTGSTRNIADTDFLSGNFHFVGGSEGGVVNYGKISALGGDVVLIGKTVDNEGSITASNTAALAAGDDVQLAQLNADGSTVTVNPVSTAAPAPGKVGVRNSGAIRAAAAELKAANGNIYALAIQNDGLVQATTVTRQGGHIYLTSDAGTIVNSGTLDASATAVGGHGGSILVKSSAGRVVHSGRIVAKGGQGGTGGRVEISGAQVDYTGLIDLTSPGGKTGDFLLDPASLTVVNGGVNAGDITGTPPNDTNNSSSSTITNGSVDNALSASNLTLSANNSITIATGAPISWTSGNTLTLETTTSGSTITINASVTGTNGGLTIHAASPTDAISTSLAGAIDVNSFILAEGAWKQLIADGSNAGQANLPQTTTSNNTTVNSQLPAFTASNDFEIQDGTFLRADSGNGSTVYYGLEDIYGVQGIGGFLSSNFTLNSRYIDASGTANWNGGAGFIPIGSYATPYQGNFDYGQINALTINTTNDDVGLIGYLGNSGSVYGINLYNPSITGGSFVGTLVGESEGSVSDNYVSGGSVTGSNDVGGLVGYQQGTPTGQITGSGTFTGTGTSNTTNPVSSDNNSVYNITVTGTSYVGGLVGEADSEVSNNTVGTGVTVTGNADVGGVAGLLDSDGTVSASTFEGAVRNDDSAGESYDFGGIVGENYGTISTSNVFPAASVQGDEYVGGIAGDNQGFIYDCYNSGSVTGVAYTGGNGLDGGNSYIGGIAGDDYNTSESEEESFVHADFANTGEGVTNQGVIQTSYNTGAVSGGTYVGGIVGTNYATGTVNTCYNVGSVTGTGYVGGVVGDNYGLVLYTYDSGQVTGLGAGTGTGSGTSTGTGLTTVAGIVGFDEDGATTSSSYWDISTSGQLTATNSNAPSGSAASEFNLASVDSSTAYTQANNNGGNGNSGDGAGYSYFGASSLVSNTNGVYAITVPQGGSPDNGGPSWYIIEGQTRPLLAMEAVTTINNPHSLQLIAENLSGDYSIDHNIDLSVIQNRSEVWNTAGFVPIGADPNASGSNVAFSGYLYGGYDTINSLYIDRPSTNDVGLFGYADGSSSLNDVFLAGSQVTGQNHVGALAGTSYGSVYYATTTGYNGTDSLVTGGSEVGGLVGDNFGTITQGTDSNDHNTPTVTGGENVGGIAGSNEDGATISQSTNDTEVVSSGVVGTNFGGLAGYNAGTVTQSINTGNIGSGAEADVGGLVGDNFGQVDDSYSGGGSGSGAINGSGTVGGLVGMNEAAGIVETSYNTSAVISFSSPTTGGLIGINAGTARHSYYDNQTTGQSVAIGSNSNTADTTDVPAGGYTTAQLTDARNFAQGSAPIFWDFSPQTGESQGVWGIDVYNYNGQVNDGLPVLQWQYSVNAQVTATSGQQYYGYQPGYTVTGNGASQFPTYVPNPTVNVTGDPNAGGTQQISVSGTPNNYNYNVEYVPGTTTIVPDPITITANSYNISSGAPAPNYTATYSGFQPNGSPSDLNGMLTFTVTPAGTADGIHTITPSGQYSSNYDITYINGVLNVGTASPGQELLTFETELESVMDSFENDPTNGLDPVYFLIFPNIPGIGGDEAGAINDPPAGTDYAFVSGTSNLPAFDRLVTAGTGVVEIIDGVIVVGCPENGNPVYLSNPGTCLPADAIGALSGVLSSGAYNQLFSLTHGSTH